MKKDSAQNRFAQSIRELRIKVGFQRGQAFSQRTAAKEMKVAHRVYWSWETHGNVTLRSMEKVAKFYGVDVRDLL